MCPVKPTKMDEPEAYKNYTAVPATRVLEGLSVSVVFLCTNSTKCDLSRSFYFSSLSLLVKVWKYESGFGG